MLKEGLFSDGRFPSCQGRRRRRSVLGPQRLDCGLDHEPGCCRNVGGPPDLPRAPPRVRLRHQVQGVQPCHRVRSSGSLLASISSEETPQIVWRTLRPCFLPLLPRTEQENFVRRLQGRQTQLQLVDYVRAGLLVRVAGYQADMFIWGTVSMALSMKSSRSRRSASFWPCLLSGAEISSCYSTSDLRKKTPVRLQQFCLHSA